MVKKVSSYCLSKTEKTPVYHFDILVPTNNGAQKRNVWKKITLITKNSINLLISIFLIFCQIWNSSFLYLFGFVFRDCVNNYFCNFTCQFRRKSNGFFYTKTKLWADNGLYQFSRHLKVRKIIFLENFLKTWIKSATKKPWLFIVSQEFVHLLPTPFCEKTVENMLNYSGGYQDSERNV